MLHVLGCITEQHDLRLVLLAGVLCLFACLTAMSMIARGQAAQGRLRIFWLVAAGVVAGCGIWGTHFVAMLAYRSGFPVAYDLGLTVLSVLVAVTLCGAGFMIAVGRAGAIVGGAVTGAAISAMHYIGMAAVRAPADAVWDARYVTASAIVGIVLTAAGMHIALKRSTTVGFATAGVLLTVAICSMHFTGMSAVTFRPDPFVTMPNAVLDPDSLAIAVAAIAVLIVALGLVGALLDHHLAARATGEAERLRVHVNELEATKIALEATSENLTLALQSADAANQAKSQFLAAMSHELRTPLNAVIGFSEMLKLESFGPLGNVRYREYAHDIHKSGGRLLAMINDILDLTHLDSGQIAPVDEDLDVSEVIGEAIHMLEGQAEAAGVSVMLAAAEGYFPRVRADRRRIRQVLVNLLSNAIKFTPAKGAVRVRAYRDVDEIAVAISDTGIGIAQHDIAQALERFGQVDARLSRKYEGAGLGLPLSRQLMALHGGRLAIDSEENVGTTVTIVFPAARVVTLRRVA